MIRHRLREEVTNRRVRADTDALERLLLTVEELASNGLRHGRPPIEATVSATTHGWLVDITDAAIDVLPVAATDRDPAEGGLGLQLVAQISRTYGWSVERDRKHVWAYVQHR